MSSRPASQSRKRGRPTSHDGGAQEAGDSEADPELEEPEDQAASAMISMLSGADGGGGPSPNAQASEPTSRRPPPRPKSSSKRHKGRKKAARLEGNGGGDESDSDTSAVPNFIKQRSKRPVDEHDDLEADELEEITDALRRAEIEYREARQLGPVLTDLVGPMVLLRPHPARWWVGAAARVNFFLGEEDLAALRAARDIVPSPEAPDITAAVTRVNDQDGLMGTLYSEAALLRRALQVHGRAGFLRRRALLEDILDDVEDAVRGMQGDELFALDDFAERLNRAEREEAGAQHGLRSDWWWPKAETLEQAKKEREGRCTLPVAIQALGVANYVVMAVEYSLVPPEHRLQYRFGPVFECAVLLDEIARRGRAAQKQRYIALYRERRVSQVRMAALQGGEGVLVSGTVVDSSGVRLGLWRDLTRLKHKTRNKMHLLGAKWLTRAVAIRFLGMKHRDLTMIPYLPPLEPHSDGTPGALYNERDLQALAAALGDMHFHSRMDYFATAMDKAAALARQRNAALQDKARELQEEREEEDQRTDRWTEPTVRVFWGLSAQDLEELEVEVDGDQGGAAGGMEKSWSTAALVAAGMRKHGRLGGLMRHLARVEERWLQTREEARDVRKRLLAFMQEEEEEDEEQEEKGEVEEGKEATFRRLDGDEANTWLARDEAMANFMLTQHDLASLPHSGRRWTADSTVEYNQRALREAAEGKYGQAYARRRQAMEHAWIERICQRLCQGGNAAVLHPTEADDAQASWWERLPIMTSGMGLVSARSKVGALVDGEPAKRGAAWATAMQKLAQEVVQRRVRAGKEAEERRSEALERAERLARDGNLVELGAEGPGVGQPMWKTTAAQSDTADDEGSLGQPQGQHAGKSGQEPWRQLLAVSVPIEQPEDPDEGGPLDQRVLTYEVRPVTLRHAAKAWALETPPWRDVCSYLVVYRDTQEGAIPPPVVCREWDGSAEASFGVRDMWGEVVVLEGVELGCVDGPVVEAMKAVVEAAYDQVYDPEDWWIGEEDRRVADLRPGPVCEWALVELGPILDAVRQWRREGGYGASRAVPMPMWIATPNQPACMLLPPLVFESLRLALPGPGGEAEMRRFLEKEVMAWATHRIRKEAPTDEPPPEPKENKRVQRKKPQRDKKLAAALREGLDAAGGVMKRLAELNPVVVTTKDGWRIPDTQLDHVRGAGAWMCRSGQDMPFKARKQPLSRLREVSGCRGPACDVRRLCDLCRQCLAEHCGCTERPGHVHDRFGLPSRLLPEVGPFRRYHDAVLRERVHVRQASTDVVQGGPASWALYPGALGAGEELGNPSLVRELQLTQIENALNTLEKAPTGDVTAPPPRELLDYIQALVHKERPPLARAIQGSLDESALVALGVLVEEAVGALMDQVVKRGREGGRGKGGVRDFDVDDAVRSVMVHVGREPEPEDVGRVLGTLYGPPEEEWGEEMEDRVNEVMTRLGAGLVGRGARQEVVEGSADAGDGGVEETKGGGA